MLSMWHLIIIFTVALVFFGPDKLPELARNLGKVMAEFRRHTADLRSTFEDHMRDLEREADLRRIGGGTQSATATPASAVTTAASQPQPAGTVPTSAANSADRTAAANQPEEASKADEAATKSAEVHEQASS